MSIKIYTLTTTVDGRKAVRSSLTKIVRTAVRTLIGEDYTKFSAVYREVIAFQYSPENIDFISYKYKFNIRVHFGMKTIECWYCTRDLRKSFSYK